MRTYRRVVVFGALVIAVAACSGEGDTATSTTAAPAQTTTTLATTTTQPISTTTEAATTTEPTTTTAVTTTAVTTTTEATTTTTLPPFPPEREGLEHGGEAWVVILAASEDFDDPALDQAVDDATAAGYHTGPTDCDAGVAEALGLPENSYLASVSVYLENEADAEAALVAFDARGVDGTVAMVTTFCLD